MDDSPTPTQQNGKQMSEPIVKPRLMTPFSTFVSNREQVLWVRIVEEDDRDIGNLPPFALALDDRITIVVEHGAPKPDPRDARIASLEANLRAAEDWRRRGCPPGEIVDESAPPPSWQADSYQKQERKREELDAAKVRNAELEAMLAAKSDGMEHRLAMRLVQLEAALAEACDIADMWSESVATQSERARISALRLLSKPRGGE